ncbi:MAG: site-specific recombinase, invertase Pin [Eubacterium sp.]|jgi:DNA invertase Pin-like site-specific DNA recombinase|nr:site-specific recombinase, invertase Pin [Eubacterium sp.]
MKRVVAYCRVSTDDSDQLNSLENQKTYFRHYIDKNPGWEFIDIYVDEGISGTSINKRNGFKKMIKDAENKRFDLVITKEISRFARNTLDSIFYTRKLKELNVGVYFMNDNINTLDPDSELRLTIMAGIAQDESRKTSERVKWGQKRSMEKGVVFGVSVLGYNLSEGKLTINEAESKIVKLIFDLYLNHGMGTHVLCKELETRGILSPSGSKSWNNASLLKILKNEKYIGILKQKKEITVDYLSHKRKRNTGSEEYIIIENNHQPIIETDIFYRVQEEIQRRQTYTFDNSKYSNRFAWSGKIECAYCKSKFKRRIWRKKDGSQKISWQCSTAIKYGKEKIKAQNEKVGCNCRSLNELILQELFLTVLSSVTKNRKKIIQEVKQAIYQAINEDTAGEGDITYNKNETDKINFKKAKLIELFTDGQIKREEFNKINSSYNRQIDILEDNIKSIQKNLNSKKELAEKMVIIEKAIMNIAEIQEFSGEVCKHLLNKLIVKDREELTFYINGTENATAGFSIPLSITPYLRQKVQFK